MANLRKGQKQAPFSCKRKKKGRVSNGKREGCARPNRIVEMGAGRDESVQRKGRVWS